MARSLSRRLHRHYRGFAAGQLREWEKDGFRSAKKLLYVLRTTLTGTHALLTGEIETDVTVLLDSHGFGAARELVEAKRRGERSELTDEMSARWRVEVARAFDTLDAALARSALPEEPPNVREVDAWLVGLRRRGLASGRSGNPSLAPGVERTGRSLDRPLRQRARHEPDALEHGASGAGDLVTAKSLRQEPRPAADASSNPRCAR